MVAFNQISTQVVRLLKERSTPTTYDPPWNARRRPTIRMTELSGTLEGVGLPAIVRFLSGLQKTGCLRIEQNAWRGEIFFDLGHVTGASLGSHQGLSALDALVQALPGGSFTFDAAAREPGAANISL